MMITEVTTSETVAETTLERRSEMINKSMLPVRMNTYSFLEREILDFMLCLTFSSYTTQEMLVNAKKIKMDAKPINNINRKERVDTLPP